MKKLTMEEYEQAGKTIGEFVKPLIFQIDNMFKEDSELKVLCIEPEDLPESERYRFDGSANLQTLAGLFRQRYSPLQCWYISVRNKKLYAIRGKRSKNANKIKSNQ